MRSAWRRLNNPEIPESREASRGEPSSRGTRLRRALITGGGALLHPRLYSSRPYFLRSSSEGAFAGLALCERGISVWPRVAPTTRLGAVARGRALKRCAPTSDSALLARGVQGQRDRRDKGTCRLFAW